MPAPGVQEYSGLSSARSQCGMKRLQQSGVAERLEQALCCTLFEQSWAHRLIPVSGNKNNGNLLPATLQLPLEIGSGHSRHGNVEDQTSGLADVVGIQELLCR